MGTASATGSSSSATSTVAEAQQTAGPSLSPSLVLNGPDTVKVESGKPYTPCLGSMAQGCELGATATLEATGDLNSKIKACADQVGPACGAGSSPWKRLTGPNTCVM